MFSFFSVGFFFPRLFESGCWSVRNVYSLVKVLLFLIMPIKQNSGSGFSQKFKRAILGRWILLSRHIQLTFLIFSLIAILLLMTLKTNNNGIYLNQLKIRIKVFIESQNVLVKVFIELII